MRKAPSRSLKSDDELRKMFEIFWCAYPRKKDKLRAERSFSKAVKDGASLDEMLAALMLQKQSNDWQEEGGKFIPHPATWLNGKRWQDEEKIDLPSQSSGGTHTPTEEELQRAYDQEEKLFQELFGNEGAD